MKKYQLSTTSQRSRASRFPNLQETLFVAHQRGPRLIAGALQCSVLLGAVYIAILLVDCGVFSISKLERIVVERLTLIQN